MRKTGKQGGKQEERVMEKERGEKGIGRDEGAGVGAEIVKWERQWDKECEERENRRDKGT